MASLTLTDLASDATLTDILFETQYNLIENYINARNAASADWDALSVLGTTTLKGAVTLQAALAMGANKITGLTNGTAIQDAGAFGQIKILQIIENTSSSTTSTTSSSYQTTTCTATITPSSTSSTILVFASGAFTTADANLGNPVASIFRDSTDLMTGGNGGFASIFSDAETAAIGGHATGFIEDSPSSTSAIVYSVKLKIGGGITANWGNDRTTTMVLMEVNGL